MCIFTLRVSQMRVNHTHLGVLPQKGIAVADPLGILLLHGFVVVCTIPFGGQYFPVCMHVCESHEFAHLEV